MIAVLSDMTLYYPVYSEQSFGVSKFFYPPTDAQENCLKTTLKFTLTLTLLMWRMW